MIISRWQLAASIVASVSFAPASSAAPISYISWISDAVPITAVTPADSALGFDQADFYSFRITNQASPGHPAFVQTYFTIQEVSLDGSGLGLGAVDEYIAIHRGLYSDTSEIADFSSILKFGLNHSDPAHFLLASPLQAGDYTVIIRSNRWSAAAFTEQVGYRLTMSGIESVSLSVPEPSSLLLAAGALACSLLLRRRTAIAA